MVATEAGERGCVLKLANKDGPEGRLYDLLALSRAMVHLDAGLGVERMSETERERVAGRLSEAVARRY